MNIIHMSLSEEEARTLNAVLDFIIPPSGDGTMPGASEVHFFSYMTEQQDISWVQEGLQGLIEESSRTYDKPFSRLTEALQLQFITELRKRFSSFFNRLTQEVIKCYYQSDAVQRAIGLEPRPPFPKGYHVEEGDLTLLEPVYERGKIYRD